MPPVEDRGRITARMPQAIQDKLKEAVELTGATLSQFVVQSALERAELILEREKQICLTRADAAMLIDLLEHPPRANGALRKALKQYKNKVQDGTLDSNAGQEP